MLPPLLKKLLIMATIAFSAILFGQFYLNGKPIAARISQLVGQPQQYEIIQDTREDMAYYAGVAGRKIPILFTQARKSLASWLDPSVTGKSSSQSPRN